MLSSREQDMDEINQTVNEKNDNLRFNYKKEKILL
jgi:hypothetical protein